MILVSGNTSGQYYLSTTPGPSHAHSQGFVSVSLTSYINIRLKSQKNQRRTVEKLKLSNNTCCNLVEYAHFKWLIAE